MSTPTIYLSDNSLGQAIFLNLVTSKYSLSFNTLTTNHWTFFPKLSLQIYNWTKNEFILETLIKYLPILHPLSSAFTLLSSLVVGQNLFRKTGRNIDTIVGLFCSRTRKCRTTENSPFGLGVETLVTVSKSSTARHSIVIRTSHGPPIRILGH